jgi:hypothetical protein
MTERLMQRYCIKFCQKLGKTQAVSADVIDKVRILIMNDHHLTVREIADEVGISRGSANMILTEDWGMRRATTKFVPKMLSPEQQQLHLEVMQYLLESTNRKCTVHSMWGKSSLCCFLASFYLLSLESKQSTHTKTKQVRLSTLMLKSNCCKACPCSR